ncbi:hypothetical protein AM493_00740 [Flavobacterium akiainvivens]|uniref:Uncharacterized protein n=1 Tax=Flavobacterium akiainvivens TaxID=1202724 RepID=A0A0M8M8I1_9FLAO|nr:hypothetical protein AM493_00740 [Flavobacterium akiainvivens]
MDNELQANNPGQIVDITTIYKLINHCLSQGKPFINPVANNLIDGNPINFGVEEDSLMLASLTLFSKADITYMLKQKRLEPHFRITQQFLSKNANLVSCDTLFSKLKGHNHGNFIKKQYPSGINHISMPLFSLSKQYAVLHAGYECGPMCGYGAYYIVRKTPQGWNIIHTFKDPVY